MNIWLIASIAYFSLALISFIPTLRAILKKIKLYPSGSSFQESPYFSDKAKTLLEQHYSRIQGTLLFWKNEANKYTRFHFYCLGWTIPSATLIPIITQLIDSSSYSKAFLTIVSLHTALLLGFHRALNIEKNLKAFRHGESEFYDLYRRLLDQPDTFGHSEDEQLKTYFNEVEIIRKYVRNAETDNFPMLTEEVKAGLEKK